MLSQFMCTCTKSTNLAKNRFIKNYYGIKIDTILSMINHFNKLIMKSLKKSRTFDDNSNLFL
jgi:hypothetical protein